MAATECCENCRFWVKPESGTKGDCRRYPPFLDRLGNSVSPLTPPDHWCGEWQKKK